MVTGILRVVPYESAEERMDRLETLVTAFIQHTDQDMAEMRLWRLQSQKQWGEIANKLGSFVEDVVAPNIPSHLCDGLGT
jgi:hypothetical protein